VKPPTLEQIEKILRDRRPELAEEYGVVGIGIFGS
jgi:predicted nucleotidyltransferase